MACFLVPAAEAVVVTAVALTLKKKEEKLTLPAHEAVGTGAPAQEKKFTWIGKLGRKLFLLSGLLWGGILLLAFEHLWHGEVTLFAPFLTAMSNPEDKAVMLHEMATVGVTMSAVVTAVWGIAVAVVSAKFKKRAKTAAQEG